MQNRELTIDDLASPVGEGMQSEVQPAMSYFAEGGEVEQGLFSQQIPSRPTVQMPQRMKRTAAEMLQRVPQAQMGTMRFSPLTMPGIAGRQIQRFADGGEVDGMSAEERALIANQMNAGAPVDNLFGANLTAPAPVALASFKTDIPEFTPEYTPPTGPVNLTGLTDTTLKTFPSGLGTAAPTFTFAGTQQATPSATAKSLYEQISPSSLAAEPYDFSKITDITKPTQQTFTKPELLSEAEARLKQPVLTRYEPDIKYGGLTTYLGTLQSSPYKDTDTTGGTTTGTTTGTATADWRSYGFAPPSAGSTFSSSPTWWFNRNLGVGIMAPSGGYIPPSMDWEIGGFTTAPQDTVIGGEGNDTLTGGEGVDWTDPNLFPTGNFTAVDAFTREKPTTLEDIFKVYGGVDLDAKTANVYKNAKFGWDKATNSFAITPASTAAILSSKTFKNNAGKTVDNMLSELGYTVGGKRDTATNVSAATRNGYIEALATGATDITRLANTLTKDLRSAGVFRLSPTMQTFNRIYSQYVPAATGGAGAGGAGTGGTTTSGTKSGTGGATTGRAGTGGATTGETKPGYVMTSKGLVSQALANAFGPQLEAAVKSGAIKSSAFVKPKAMGSGPEGEYADPVQALIEQQRARRELRTMDQGSSARAQLKKFLGGEDLTPVQEFAEGGEVGSISGLKAKQLAQKRGLRPEDFGAPAGSWTNQALADALGMTITKGAGGRALAIPTAMQPAKTAEDVLAEYNKLGATDFDMLDKPMSYLTEKGKAEYRTNQPLRVSQLEQMGAGLNLTPEQINQAYSTGYGTAVERYNEYLRQQREGEGGLMGFLDKATPMITKAAFAYFGGNALANSLGGAGSLAPGSVPTATAPVMVPGTEIPLSTAANVGKTAYNVSRSKDPGQALTNAAFQYGAGPTTLPNRVTDLEIIQNAGKRIGLNLGQPQFGPNVKTPDIMPQYFGKGGAVKKAADLLKSLGVTEGKVAGKELTTLQDAHTSLGDAVRERAAKMQQQMDAMQFKYGPGQYVFTESSAKKNLPPLEIKAKRLYGDQPMREPHPDNPLLGKVIKDPETGRAKRTPYEPGYLVRREGPDGQWAEFVIPESAIKGAVDGFRHGGVVHRAEGSPVTAEGYVLEPTFGERMGANVSDFLMNVGIKGADLLPADKTKMSAAHKLYLDTFGVKENRAPVTKEYFNQEEMDALSDLISRKGGKKGSMTYKDYKALMGDRPVKQYPLTSGRLDPYVSLSKSLGQFNYEYDPKTDSYRIIDEYDFNPLTSKSGVRSDSDFVGDYISEDNTLMDKLRIYAGRKLPPGTGRKVDLSVPAKKPVKRAEGSPVYGEMADTGGITPDTIAAMMNRRGASAGEVLRTLKDIYGQGVSNVESLLRGSVAAIPGSVGDIESIFRDSDKTRKFATTEEVLRDYMPKRATKPTKEAAGMEELGSYLPLPVPAGTASKVAKGAKRGAKKALEELGPTAATMAERQLQRSGLGPMYAVKPKGGTFFPPEYGSRMDEYLDQVVKDLSSSETLAGKDAKTVADFIRTKGRKYLTTTYGTSDDPLRAALLEGRLPRYGSDKERFRSYMMKAAESGDPEALQDLEKAYDAATGIRAISYVPPDMEGTTYAVSGKADRMLRERMAAEGVEPEFMNPDYPSPATKEQLEASYSTKARKNLAELMRQLENAPTAEEKQALLNALGGDLKTLSYAAEKGEPIYDVMGTSTDFMNTRNVAQGIASIPVQDLNRMSFPEAVIKGAQNMRFKRDWEAVIDNAKAGKAVPKEIFFQGTQPVYEVGKDQKWVRIMTPDAVELEGAAMRHSIGGYKTSNSYNLGGKPAFESGLARVFSLRNEKGVPQVTVESKFTEDKGLEITQIKSKFNSMPTPEEKKAVFELFDTLGPTSFKSDTYSSTRTGDRLDESKVIDWGNEYQDYLKYKNKGEE